MKTTKRLKILTVLLASSLVACGGGANPDQDFSDGLKHKVGAAKVEILNGENSLTFTSGSVEGSGQLRFAEGLPRTESAANFVLNLKLKPGGEARLITHARRDLTGGVEFEFKIADDGTQSVAALAGHDRLDLTPKLNRLDLTSEVTLYIDVHNDHGARAHVLIWGQDKSLLVDDLLRGRGYGSSVGLGLDGARMKTSWGDPWSKHP